jgi:hypothetical protein
VILAQGWHQRFYRPSPRFADDVANEKKFHHLKLIEWLVRARKSGVQGGSNKTVAAYAESR